MTVKRAWSGAPALLALVAVLAMLLVGLPGVGYAAPEGDGQFVKYYTVPAASQGKPETLTDVAERFLDDVSRADDILNLNLGRRQPDGAALTGNGQLRPGWQLVLPWDAFGEGIQYGLLPTPSAPPPSGTPSPGPTRGDGAHPDPGKTTRPTPAPSKTPRPHHSLCAPSVQAGEESVWAYQRVAPQQAWERAQGEGILVAVVDSGVDGQLPELSERVAVGADITAGNGRGDVDCVGSGTAMAGIIAGRQSGSAGSLSARVVGIAPEASILPVRVIKAKPPARPVDVATGIEVAVSAGAKVIALGGYVDVEDQSVRDAVVKALSHDVVVVAPAPTGDGAGSTSGTASASSAPEGMVRVAGVGPDGQFAASYLSGAVDVVGPGVDVASYGGADGGLRAGSGTAYAVAFVAGTAALVRSAFPNLDAAQVAKRLRVTANPLVDQVPHPMSGWGMISPVAAVSTDISAEARPVGADDDGEGEPWRRFVIGLVVVIGFGAVGLLAWRLRKVPSAAGLTAATDRGVVGDLPATPPVGRVFIPQPTASHPEPAAGSEADAGDGPSSR
ncbi:S8 family serine peptidase [Micromonospora lupini]|uniref:S8 family serine peptidase n=1 Tax=Micromonospora lupini TaxID=285679 RepID=UPI0031E1FD94